MFYTVDNLCGIQQSSLSTSRALFSFLLPDTTKHQVKTCLKNTSLQSAVRLLPFLEYSLLIFCLYILLLTGYSYTGSRCGDCKFPFTLYKSKTVLTCCIFADCSFWYTFLPGVQKNNLGVQKIKINFSRQQMKALQKSETLVCNKTLIEGENLPSVKIFKKSATLLLWFALSSLVFLRACFWHAQLLFSSVVFLREKLLYKWQFIKKWHNSFKCQMY